MNLERLTIAIRPRRDWEAVDLGILMARRWWGSLFSVWLITTLPLFIPVVFLSAEHINWYFVVIWLCKPLFERPLLMILSQGVFGNTPSIKEVLKATPKLMLLQILPSITWRRFSATRAMDLAVIQLEGLHGSQRQARLSILHRQDAKPAKWLTILGAHMESFLCFALVALIALLIPSGIHFELFESDTWLATKPQLVVWAGLYYLSLACVAPFYVACGFSLYLNRRVKLEGWDLEIAFKRMVQKRGLALQLLPLFLGLSTLFCVAAPSLSHAQDDAIDSATTTQITPHELERRKAVQQEFITLTHGEPFHVRTIEKVFKAAQPDKVQQSDLTWLKEVFRRIAEAMHVVAQYLEYALWALVAALIVFVALRFRRWQAFFAERGMRRSKPYHPKTLFGMEVSKESLPPNISHAALELWQAGEHRAALALLYRASLSRLLYNGLPLKDGSTEQECLWMVNRYAAAQGIPAPVIAYFADLTEVWRCLAYGHISPPLAKGEHLCQNWNPCWLEDHHE